ncbi:MAG: hypothetical protein WBA39_34790 [Rivularia sp. (in: cyanobacteria)]
MLLTNSIFAIEGIEKSDHNQLIIPELSQQIMLPNLDKVAGGFSALSNGAVLIRWDDTNSKIPRVNKNDNDFDDFIIRAGGHEECIEE